MTSGSTVIMVNSDNCSNYNAKMEVEISTGECKLINDPAQKQ